MVVKLVLAVGLNPYGLYSGTSVPFPMGIFRPTWVLPYSMVSWFQSEFSRVKMVLMALAIILTIIY